MEFCLIIWIWKNHRRLRRQKTSAVFTKHNMWRRHPGISLNVWKSYRMSVMPNCCQMAVLCVCVCVCVCVWRVRTCHLNAPQLSDDSVLEHTVPAGNLKNKVAAPTCTLPHKPQPHRPAGTDENIWSICSELLKVNLGLRNSRLQTVHAADAEWGRR